MNQTHKVSISAWLSPRPYSSRLFWWVMALVLCFTVATSPLQAQNPCVFADVNCDGVVDDADLLQVLFCFGTQPQPTVGDINLRLRQCLPRAIPDRFMLNLPIDNRHAAFASTRLMVDDGWFDVFAAWAARAHLWQFTPEQIARGEYVGAVYLPGGFAPDGTPLSERFYLVWMYRDDLAGRWRIDLRDTINGNPIVMGLPVQAQVVPPSLSFTNTYQDITIAVEPRIGPVLSYRAEIHLSFLCTNGLHLQKAPVWYRDFPW